MVSQAQRAEDYDYGFDDTDRITFHQGGRARRSSRADTSHHQSRGRCRSQGTGGRRRWGCVHEAGALHIISAGRRVLPGSFGSEGNGQPQKVASQKLFIFFINAKMQDKKKQLAEQISSMKEKGLSNEQIRIRLNVSLATVKRYLKKSQTDPEVKEFAAKVFKLAEEAPDGYCRKEIYRAVHKIRRYRALNEDKKGRLVSESLRSGATTVLEIMEDTRLPRADIETILKTMLDEKKARAVKPCGRDAAGRKTKFSYHLI